ncbi:hypothetical protein CFOL_v3_15648 [Cephalotus follicularis]|uniref:Uncharacterized protein n=1 Tax=Cephalotus follicularis TaxID=3775 RepID=A0A1Q3BWA7_CEPFO|nr:hypothetical protein CFOL_v3_15648 [Cephalotus follicularis]
MSFLAGRLAGKEGAYFFEQSKHAINRLVEKTTTTATATATTKNAISQADVLPEVLRHSLPPKMFAKPSDPSSLSAVSKWALHSDPNTSAAVSPTVSPDALNPLRAYVSLPQVTFGPKRWELPSQEHSVLASTANDMRKDRYTPIDAEKLKAAAQGLTQIGKAFAVATAIVFGGFTLIFGMAASRLQIHNSDDIRNKGKDLVQPKFEMIREQVYPIRTWADGMSKKWKMEREENVKEKPITKELSKILGAKSST